ncbi:hypothetical protein FQA39_LY15985 [Lamprigera yunnana]|nr:hypothetical protein FQA39_LY15985 [Lamprigera yunnana]
MDAKKSPIRRTKRQAKVLEDFWDCSVCTFRNTAEAFKCLMCDVRKGTSTRKPRINPQLVAQQVASQFVPATSNQKREKKDKRSLKKRRHPPRLKNVDRSSAQTREVTVNSVTVVITEYKPKIKSTETISTSSSSDHDHEAIYGMEIYYTVQQCEELRDKYKIGRKVCRKFLKGKTCSQCLLKRISEIGLRHFLDTINKYIKDCSDSDTSSSSSDEEECKAVKQNGEDSKTTEEEE